MKLGISLKKLQRNCNFHSSNKVQGAMVEVVEFKSNNMNFNSFFATKCRGKTS